MEETSKRRWTTIVFFSALCILFSGFIYFLAFGPKDTRYSRIQSQSSTVSGLTDENKPAMDPKRIVLPRGQRITYDNLILIYQGKQQRRVLLDVIIPDLDPKVAYHHVIPIPRAKIEFHLASQRFKLISSSHSILRISRIP